MSEYAARLVSARTLTDLMIIEARASAAYWRTFSSAGLREAKGGNLPRSWLRFANRQKGAGFLGSKNAAHPISAMLNYAYVLEAGRLAKALSARGLALQIGSLHSDKKGRNSLVWDAIEYIRPKINAGIFAFIRENEFRRSDFVQLGSNTFRLERSVIQAILSDAILPQRDIDGAADKMLQIIEANSGTKLFKPDLRRQPRARLDRASKRTRLSQSVLSPARPTP